MALPNGYKKIRYIQSSGTQYIDTGYKPNNNTRVVIDCNVLSSGGSVQAVFGGRTSADTTSGAMFAVFFTNTTTLRSDYNGAYTQAFSVPMDTRIVIDKNKETTSVNGASQSYANASFQSAGTLALFALNENGTIESGTRASMILFSCQVYDNGSLVRDFIPALRISDNAAGLYDLVNGVFYANAGSGSFTYDLAAGAVTGIGASLIEDTSYGINSGKTIVDGTAYDINKGKTLVGGTAYDIAFSLGIPVTITGGGSYSSAYVIINGVRYYSAGSDIVKVSPGDDIVFRVVSSTRYNGWVSIDGVTYGRQTGGSKSNFHWTVPDGCEAITINIAYSDSSTSTSYSRYTVTTK